MVRFGHLIVLLAALVGSGQAACAIDPDASGFLAIPSSWTTIPDDAFNGCQTLVHVVIPGTVNAIGVQAFRDCRSLTTVVINSRANPAGWDGVVIGESAFNGNSGLVHLDLGTTVRTIGTMAFQDCTSLPTVVVPNSVTMVSVGAFRWCNSLRSATIPATTSYASSSSSSHPFHANGCRSKPVPMFFPGANVFNCSQCTIHPENDGTLTIPSSWTTIPDKAFQWCDTLLSVVVPDTVRIIGAASFGNCAGLATVRVGSSATDADPSLIGSGAFEDCVNLASVTIGNSVHTINESAFKSNSGLVHLDLGTSVRTIGTTAFQDCRSLPTVVVPNSVTMVSVAAFRWCNSLRSATIPATTSYASSSSSSHPFYGTGCGSTAMFVPGAMLVDCQIGGTWYPSTSPTTGAPTTRSPTPTPTPTPTTAPSVPRTAQTTDVHANCAVNFSCFTDISTPHGVGAFTRHTSEADPKENEPHVELFQPPGQSWDFPVTAAVRGHGGVVGAPRGSTGALEGDFVMHIWIVDDNGNTLCHVDSDCARQVLVLRCSVALTLDAATVQAHVFCRLTGLYSGPVLNWANEVYALIKERSAHPNGVGSAYYHQAFDSVQQQIHSIEGGRLPDTTVATEAGQSNFVAELLARLAVYNRQVSRNTVPGISPGDVHRLTDAHASDGVAAILRQALANTCTFNASIVAASLPAPAGHCTLDDAVGLAVAFTTGADPRPEARHQDTMARLRAAFQASLPRAMTCVDDARPWDVRENCLAPARELFLAAVGPLVREYHHYFVLAVHTLKYIHVLYTASSPAELDPHIELDLTTSSFWCGVLGEGGSTTTLTDHAVDAIWIRDQRGAVVYFANLTGSSGPPRVDFNLDVLSYTATSLTPYQFSPGRGVWRGRDPLAPPTVFFQRFTTGLAGPTGGPVPWGRYFSGRTPRMYEPFLTFHRDGWCVVGVRDENGSRAVGNSQLHHHIIKIYIQDQDGNVVCESFSNGQGIQTMQCVIPSTAVTIQCHVQYDLYGLWSGRVLNARHEVYAGTREAMASPTGTGRGYGHEAFGSLDARLLYWQRGFCGIRVAQWIGQPAQNIMSVLRFWAVEYYYTELLRWGAVSSLCPCGAGLTYAQYFSWAGFEGVTTVTLTNVQFGRGMASLVRYVMSCGCTYAGTLSIDVAIRFSVAYIEGCGGYGGDPAMLDLLRAALRAAFGAGGLECDPTDPADAGCIRDCLYVYYNALGNAGMRYLHWCFTLIIMILRHLSVIMVEAEKTMSQHEPYIQLNPPSHFVYTVLGDGGSATPRAVGHGVEAMWVRDQHGVIVHFMECADGVPPTFTFDLTTLTTSVTSLIPWQYGEHGLWRGFDPMAGCGCSFGPDAGGGGGTGGGGVPGGGGGSVTGVTGLTDVEATTEVGDVASTTAEEGEEEDISIILVCAIVAGVAICLFCVCIFLFCCRFRYVWFLRSADGEPSYRATSGSRKTPPTEGWEVCKKDDDRGDGRASGKKSEPSNPRRSNSMYESAGSGQASGKKSEPAPRVMLGDGKGGAAKLDVVTVQGASDHMFNGTYVRTEELTQAENDEREGKIKWVKEGGTGEYMAMGGKEEKSEKQKDTALWNVENPIYDDGAVGPEGGGDGYLDVESAK